MARKKDYVAEVEAALLQRALGMTLRETRREATDKGEKTVTTEKELAPDITAQMFYLKNRRPDRWREKPPEPPAAEPENNLLEILLEAAKVPDEGTAEVPGEPAGETEAPEEAPAAAEAPAGTAFPETGANVPGSSGLEAAHAV